MNKYDIQEGDYVLKEDLIRDYETYKAVVKAFADAGYQALGVARSFDAILSYQPNKAYLADSDMDFIGSNPNREGSSCKRRRYPEEFMSEQSPEPYIPEVDEECEVCYEPDTSTYYRAKYLGVVDGAYIFRWLEGPDRTKVSVRESLECGVSGITPILPTFRRIASERDRAIKEMHRIAGDPAAGFDNAGCMASLHDAGYRKQISRSKAKERVSGVLKSHPYKPTEILCDEILDTLGY